MKEFRNFILMAAAAAICVPAMMAQDATTWVSWHVKDYESVS